MNRTLSYGSIFFVLLMVVAWWAAEWSFSSSEQLVRRRFLELLELTRVDPSVPPLERILRTKKATRYFSDTLSGEYVRRGSADEFAEQGVLSRKKIEKVLLAGFRAHERLEPRIVSAQYEEQGAQVHASGGVRFFGQRRGDEESLLEEFRFRLKFEKMEGDWVIVEAWIERIDRS